MAHISLWLLAGVMLCSLPAASLEDIPWIQKPDKGTILKLLSELEKTRPYFCLPDRNDFKFPLNLETVRQMNNTQRTCFYHVMLSQILNVFVTKRSFAEWDHTRLSELISSLHHSLEDLEDQVKEEKYNLACPSLGILIRRYFWGIHKYLKDKKYTSCAWEIVLVEVMARVMSL